jgi:hypothetical protein
MSREAEDMYHICVVLIVLNKSKHVTESNYGNERGSC